MAYQNLAAELTFCDLQTDDIFPIGGVLPSLKKYEKFIEVYVNGPTFQAHPLPPDRVVGNDLIRKWAAWKAPPLLLVICGGLPPNGDVAVRVREIARACILAAPQEYRQTRCGEILGILIKTGGAIKHLAADKATQFRHIHTYLVDMEVLRDEAATAVSELEQDKDGIRFEINAPVIDVVNNINPFNMNVVANKTEVPLSAVTTTRTDMWYTANQDYYNRMPVTTSPHGDHSHLLTEVQLQRLCGIMHDFARQVGYALRTYNKEVGSSSSSSSGDVQEHAFKHGPSIGLCAERTSSLCDLSPRDPQLHSYTSWREYGTEVPYYHWTNEMPCANLNNRRDFSFLLHSGNTRGISWPLNLDMLPIVSESRTRCKAGRTSSQTWKTHHIPYSTVMVNFLPHFKGIQIGYTTQVGLRRHGRAASNRKVFDPLLMG